MKSVRFSYSLFGSYYFLVLKVIKLLLFGPSRSSNCIDGLLIEHYFDHIYRKNRMVLAKDKVE